MKRPKWLLPIAVLLLVGGGVLYWLTKPRPTDQEKIYRVVEDARVAVEQKNASGLLDLISKDYRDASGNDRQNLATMSYGGLRGAEQYSVTPEITSLKIEGDVATAQIKARFQINGAQPGEPIELKVTAKLRREGSHWRVISASGWEAAQGAYWGD